MLLSPKAKAFSQRLSNPPPSLPALPFLPLPHIPKRKLKLSHSLIKPQIPLIPLPLPIHQPIHIRHLPSFQFLHLPLLKLPPSKHLRNLPEISYSYPPYILIQQKLHISFIRIILNHCIKQGPELKAYFQYTAVFLPLVFSSAPDPRSLL